jgi:hypothetical protein
MALRSGKMPTTSVRRRISLSSRSCGLFKPDLAPDLLGERGEGQQFGTSGIEVLGHLGELVAGGIEDSIVLGHNGWGIWLVEDGVQQSAHPGPGGLGSDGHQIGGLVGAATLPGRPRQGRADRGHQARVGVAGDQRHSGQAAGDQVTKERQPAGAVFGRGPAPRGSLGSPRR